MTPRWASSACIMPASSIPASAGTPRAATSKAVLEVRSHEVPFMLEHGQTVGWLRYERMMARPDRLYGAAIGSTYLNQGLALAKQFHAPGAD